MALIVQRNILSVSANSNIGFSLEVADEKE